MTILSRAAPTAAVVAALAALSPIGEAAPASLVDEVKLGALAHDVGFLGHHVEAGADINLEVMFVSPDWLRAIGSPRPHIGADINTDGNTSDGYLGLTWGVMLIRNLIRAGDGVFADASLGGAVQDGFLNGGAPPGRKRLGSRILFRGSAELGYQITATLSLSAFIDHMSNANLEPHNAGITSIGARLGFKF